jgi:hypothetical protein
MVLDEQKFTTGFNSGYLLAKFEPQFLKVVLKGIHPSNSYILGLSSGQKEYEFLHEKSHLDELGQIRRNSRDERNLERD